MEIDDGDEPVEIVSIADRVLQKVVNFKCRYIYTGGGEFVVPVVPYYVMIDMYVNGPQTHVG